MTVPRCRRGRSSSAPRSVGAFATGVPPGRPHSTNGATICGGTPPAVHPMPYSIVRRTAASDAPPIAMGTGGAPSGTTGGLPSASGSPAKARRSPRAAGRTGGRAWRSPDRSARSRRAGRRWPRRGASRPAPSSGRRPGRSCPGSRNPAASARRAHSSSCGPVVPRTLFGMPMPMSTAFSSRQDDVQPVHRWTVTEERSGRRLVAVLREPLHQGLDSGVPGGSVDHLRDAVRAHPQPAPVVVVVVDEQGAAGFGAHVRQSLQGVERLGLASTTEKTVSPRRANTIGTTCGPPSGRTVDRRATGLEANLRRSSAGSTWPGLAQGGSRSSPASGRRPRPRTSAPTAADRCRGAGRRSLQAGGTS